MNVKLPLGDVVRLLGEKVPINQVYRHICPLAEKIGLRFPNPIIGSGYFMWSLPGDDWISFDDISEESKSEVAALFLERKTKMQQLVGSPKLCDLIFTVPSKHFIFVRKNDEGCEIALAAWSLRYSNSLGCSNLVSYFDNKDQQQIYIGFKWEGSLVKDYNFKLEELSCKTSDDGLFKLDGLLDVGRKLHVTTIDGNEFELEVKKDIEQYIYEITRYFSVKVNVTHDGVPQSDCECTIEFDRKSHTVYTDDKGNVLLKLPMSFDSEGILYPQPPCTVICRGESQQQTTFIPEGVLEFTFQFKTEIPVITVPAADTVHPEQPLVNSEPQKVIPVEEPEEEPEKPTVAEKPNFVTIELLDYGGYPLKNIDFLLKTGRHNSKRFTTDESGLCRIPKEYFTNKKKFKVAIEISPEYQAKYDLHDT